MTPFTKTNYGCRRGHWCIFYCARKAFGIARNASVTLFSTLWRCGEVHFASPGTRICFGSSVYLSVRAEMHFAGAEKCIFVFPDGPKQNLDGSEFAIDPAARKLWASEVPAKMHLQAPCMLPEMHFATCFQAAASV